MTFRYFLVVDHVQANNDTIICRVLIFGNLDTNKVYLRAMSNKYHKWHTMERGVRNLGFWQTSTDVYRVIECKEITREKALALSRIFYGQV